jgi:hypothetical protein
MPSTRQTLLAPALGILVAGALFVGPAAMAAPQEGAGQPASPTQSAPQQTSQGRQAQPQGTRGRARPHPVKTTRKVVPLVKQAGQGTARGGVVVSSGDLDLPAEATVVGASWESGALDVDDVIQIRSRHQGQWGPWQDMAREQGKATSTEPFVAKGTQVQVRATSADGGSPQVDAVVIDPGQSDADTELAPAAAAAPDGQRTAGFNDGAARPSIASRQDWGADESIRRGSPSYGQVQAAVIHHTAGANDYTASSVPSILRGIYAYHVQTNGWNDIGYNILVDRFGRAWEGRAGGLEKAVVGAHTLGHNSSTVGVSAIGDYTSRQPSSAMLGAITAVVAWKFSTHGIPATGTVSIGGTNYNRIFGHRDAKGNSTSCPGQSLYTLLPSIRRDVASLMGEQVKVDGARSWDTDRRTDVLGLEGSGSISISRGQSVQPVASGRTIGTGWLGLDDIVLSPDFTGDGHADVIARDPRAGGLRIYRGNGEGGFAGVTRLGSGWNDITKLIAAGDRTGDGRADLLALRKDGALRLYPGDGTGWVRSGSTVGTGFNAYRSLAVGGDVDGDGRSELFALRTSDNAFVRWPATATGGLGALSVVSGQGWGAIADLIGTGDLDGDGADSDLLAVETAGGMRTYYAQGHAPLRRISYWGKGWNGLDQVTSGADWNGDGNADVVARNRSSGALVLYAGTGARDFNVPATRVPLGLDADLVRLIGDVDGDGRGDAIARDTSGNLYGLSGTASGFGAPIRIASGWQTFSQIEPAGDYTRDGVPDVLALTPGGQLRVYALSPSWTWRWETTLSSSFGGMRTVTGAGSVDQDFNGDILSVRASDGAMLLWRGTGAGALGEYRVLSTGQSDLTRLAGMGDGDGDGINDVMGQDGSGRWWLFHGTGDGLWSSRQPLAGVS